MNGVLTAHVVGLPVTQGSMKGFQLGRSTRVVNSNEATLKPWREAVRSTLVAAIAEQYPDWTPIAGPVTVRLWFALPKPMSAPKTKRIWPIGPRSGDIEKLVRAVHDAASDAGVWFHDSQVCRLLASKDYPGPEMHQTVPGVRLTIAPWDAA